MAMTKNETRALIKRLSEAPFIEHDVGNCGFCCKREIDANAMKDVLGIDPEPEDLLTAGYELANKRWKETKFFKLWQEERAAGRDPEKAFEERGWEP